MRSSSPRIRFDLVEGTRSDRRNCTSVPSDSESEPFRFPGDPDDESLDIRLPFDLFNCVPLSLQFFLGKESVDLRMTRWAESDGLFHAFAIELSLISLVVMTRSRDEMVSG
jgi:hypothetical protein